MWRRVIRFGPGFARPVPSMISPVYASRRKFAIVSAVVTCSRWPRRHLKPSLRLHNVPPAVRRPNGTLTLTRVKFTDGYWQLREGVRAQYPAEVYDVAVQPDALTVSAPMRRIAHRGDTLNEPLLTIRCASPAPDIISVSVSHFLGARPPRPKFPLNVGPSAQVGIQVRDSAASITSGALSARFKRSDGWALEFLAGDEVLTSSLQKAMALIATDS